MGRTFVVVGAGQAGVRAVRALRREGFDGRIVLLGDEPYLPYERPPLSKSFLAGKTGAEELAFHDRAWFDDNDVEVRTGVRASGLRPGERRVALDEGGGIEADAVLLATGGRPRWLPGTAPGDRVLALRTRDDAARLRDRLADAGRLVVIGGGFIGCEVAATARDGGVDVVLLEALEQPLAGVLGPQLGAWCAGLHRDHGVEVRTGVRVTGTVERTDGVEVATDDGEVHRGDLALVGVGIEPAVELAEDAGLAVRDGIVVDAACRTSVDGIFAAGDVARHDHPLFGSVRVEHFDNANHQGTAAAQAMLGRDVRYDNVHWFWSDQYDRNLQLAGHADGCDDLVLRGDPGSGEFSAFMLRDGRLRAAFAVNAGPTVMIARRLIGDGRTPSPDELADEDVDLRELVRR